jgi:molybdate transport system substrate-binding protein
MKWAPLFALLLNSSAIAGEAHIAVAANFALPARHLAQAFGQASGHKLMLASGSTGKFYAQVKSGAPFDVLLSADEETPRRLEAEKLSVPGSRFTYAVGRLVLWAPKTKSAKEAEATLANQEFKRLAIANPRLAPYGAAARQTLENLGLWESLNSRLVQGENIAQAFQFVASGNAEAGFVALSQIDRSAPHWLVPERLHAPLRQDAVLLARGADNAAARGFLEYLKTAPARERIRSYGYE